MLGEMLDGLARDKFDLLDGDDFPVGEDELPLLGDRFADMNEPLLNGGDPVVLDLADRSDDLYFVALRARAHEYFTQRGTITVLARVPAQVVKGAVICIQSAHSALLWGVRR